MTPVSPIRAVLSQLEPCLVVEDDSIIMLDIEYTLRQLGLTQIHTATTLAKAMSLEDLGDIRFAILDYELGHLANTVPLAEALAKRGISLIFLTAYGANVDLPASLCHVPVLSKPFTTAMMLDMLNQVTASREAASPQRLCG